MFRVTYLLNVAIIPRAVKGLPITAAQYKYSGQTGILPSSTNFLYWLNMRALLVKLKIRRFLPDFHT